MKILFLPAYFFPEAPASFYISDNRNEAFALAGFTMEVYAPAPSRGISEEIRKQYEEKRNETMYNGSMIVYRFPMFKEKANTVLRTFRYVCCSIIQFTYALVAKDIDVMFISSTPPIQGAVAGLIKKIRKIPFVYSLQDIFPDSLISTGLTRRGTILWNIGRKIENFTYRNADKIIVISEGFKKNIMDKGVPESKIEVIYNWVDENAVVPVRRDENILFERYGIPRDKFCITYSGNIGLTQNMDLLMDVAEMLKGKPEIHFVLVGEGAYKQEVEKQTNEKQLNNVTLLPFQPYEDISHVFSLGDVGLVISKAQVGQNSVPSKTWSILSAGRPVLASFDQGSELQKIIEDNHLGVFVKAGNKIDLYNAIIFLYQNKGLCAALGTNGRNFILKNLTRESGTSKYVRVLESVLASYQC
ncbi:MAG: glycosyltransferase family 4 protein [Mangrovibacterium sp.]